MSQLVENVAGKAQHPTQDHGGRSKTEAKANTKHQAENTPLDPTQFPLVFTDWMSRSLECDPDEALRSRFGKWVAYLQHFTKSNTTSVEATYVASYLLKTSGQTWNHISDREQPEQAPGYEAVGSQSDGSEQRQAPTKSPEPATDVETYTDEEAHSDAITYSEISAAVPVLAEEPTSINSPISHDERRELTTIIRNAILRALREAVTMACKEKLDVAHKIQERVSIDVEWPLLWMPNAVPAFLVAYPRESQKIYGRAPHKVQAILHVLRSFINSVAYNDDQHGRPTDCELAEALGCTLSFNGIVGIEWGEGLRVLQALSRQQAPPLQMDESG